MADTTPRSYSADTTLYLYTSLTAGSSHIITATSRMETILKANRIPFRAIDVATDEKARMLWGRRSKGRKLPGLVRCGMIVGDLNEVEEWNEYGELKQQIRATDPSSASTASAATPTRPTITNMPPANPMTPSGPQSPASHNPTPNKHIDFKGSPSARNSPAPPTSETEEQKEGGPSIALALRQAGTEAAKKAGEMKAEKTAALKATLTKGKDGANDTPATTDSSTSLPAPPEIEPTAAQIREAPTPTNEAVAETVTKHKETSNTTAANEPPTSGTLATSGASQIPEIKEPEHTEPPTTSTATDTDTPGIMSPPPTSTSDPKTLLHYSPNPTPAMTSTESLEVAETDKTAEHHRESHVSVEAPKEVVEQVEREQAIPEDKAMEEVEEKKGDEAAEGSQEKKEAVMEEIAKTTQIDDDGKVEETKTETEEKKDASAVMEEIAKTT